MDKARQNFLDILKKSPESGKLAMFYGFFPINPPKILKHDIDATKDMDPKWRPESKAALLREISEAKGNSMPQPLMLWTGETRSAHKIECTLSIINSNKSITEAILLQSARAILENAGFKNTFVRINSVGSKEAVVDFERKMNIYLRKKFNEFPPELRQGLKKDPFFLIKSKDEKYKIWKDSAPQSIDCLNEDSRQHFKEVLEFLETLDIPYVIDGSLLGDVSYATENVFEIVSEDGEEILAWGSRFNRLSRKLAFKKELPAVDVTISAKALRAQKTALIKELKPKFYLIQFGPEAKLKSLIVLEKLRRAGVAVFHSLAKDKLTGQIMGADQMNIPYIILLGQKEALENSVVIRNTSTRSQSSVPISILGEFIKSTIKDLMK